METNKFATLGHKYAKHFVLADSKNALFVVRRNFCGLNIFFVLFFNSTMTKDQRKFDSSCYDPFNDAS